MKLEPTRGPVFDLLASICTCKYLPKTTVRWPDTARAPYPDVNEEGGSHEGFAFSHIANDLAYSTNSHSTISGYPRSRLLLHRIRTYGLGSIISSEALLLRLQGECTKSNHTQHSSHCGGARRRVAGRRRNAARAASGVLEGRVSLRACCSISCC